ncbi:MAG: transposase [Zoogloeaceae bacterium]|jgi:putative transposase|nr:transposase [Zoogloeaceae bacterium]
MLMTHKIALDLNNVQTTHMARAAGCARFAYNWALGEWGKQYAAWKENKRLPKPNQMALRRQLNSIKREQFPWMLEVTKCAPQRAIMQLGDAFRHFFAGRAKYPKFRKKGVHDRFSLSNDQFCIEGSRLRVPNLGWVKLRETLRFTGKIISATISRVADRWFVSITVDVEEHVLPKAENELQDKNQVTSEFRRSQNQGEVGVDLGVKALATLSTGESIEGPKALKHLLCRLRRLSRSVSRKVKGGKNRHKARQRLARLRARIGNLRGDALHKLTTDITRRFHTIGIEDLNVRDMTRNRCLARSVSDMGFHEFRRQLEYKAAMRGGQVVVTDRFIPSRRSALPSPVAGTGLEPAPTELPLFERARDCPQCGARHDRDVDAATNLKNKAVSSTVSACEGEGSGSGRKDRNETIPGEAGSQQQTRVWSEIFRLE